MASHRLTPNIPETITVKYSDIVPGEYGAQVRLKGKINGADVVVYLPGKIEDVVATLLQAGLITAIPAELEPEKAVTLPLTRMLFQICASQPAGQKHPSLTLPDSPAGAAAAPPTTAHAPATSQRTPSSGAALTALYNECFRAAWKRAKTANDLENAPFEFTGAEVCAIAATLFIEANKRGLTTINGTES